MYLTGLTHRNVLFDLTMRWFADDPHPDDGRLVTRIIACEPLITAPVIRRFFLDVHDAVRPGRIGLQRLHVKEQLREAIIAGCRTPSPRARKVFAEFRAHPEEFFPGTPSDLLLATSSDGALLGMIRAKRIRRIAEKASRRIADRLAGRIRETAEQLASARAKEAGVPLSQLFSSAETMRREFEEAEQIVSRGFEKRSLVLRPQEMRIDDVMGAKLIGSEAELAGFERAIAEHPAATIVEREVHTGRYNATNLLVDLTVPDPEQLAERARHIDWSFAAARGLDVDALRDGFAGYVREGSRTFRSEIILTTPEELVESEFGRSIHEERILEQRRYATYTGRIAQNASFLIQFLLTLAISPTVHVDRLPVKMWGRYLPDTFSAAFWQLFGHNPEVPPEEVYGTNSLEPG
jgi:hypothetical protein